jgi:hypothetical protein
MKILQKILLLLLLSVLLFLSCKKEKVEMESAYSFGKVKIDSKVKDDEIFHWLSSQNDFDMSGDGIREKTSAAQYYSKRKDELEIPPYYFFNNCRTKIIRDTLFIRIGTTTYLSDFGIIIKYKNGKFNSVPFELFDIVLPDSLLKPQVYYNRNRKLILDKYNYKIGDTVFGRIHSEIEEPLKKNSKGNKHIIEHFVDGYFKAIIEK